MARIRSIHPNVTVDPDYSGISRDARLLGVYALTVADDPGNLEHSGRSLKMSCFPGDDDLTVADVERLRDELIAIRYFVPYEFGGKTYLHIRNFPKYQKPDHPTAPKFPLFPGQTFTYETRKGNAYISKTVKGPFPERSPNTPRTIPDRECAVLAEVELDLERKGKEWTGGESPNDTLPPGALEAPADRASTEDEASRNIKAMNEHLARKQDPNNGGANKSGREGKVPKEPGLTTDQVKALASIQGSVMRGDLSPGDAAVHLQVAHGFTPAQLDQVEVLLKEAEQA